MTKKIALVVVFVVVAGCSSTPDKTASGESPTPAVSETTPDQAAVLSKITTGGGPNFLGAAGGAMWVSLTDGGSVAAIDPERDKVTDRVKVAGAPDFLMTGFGDVWVTSTSSGDVWRIDPETAEIAAKSKLPSGGFGLGPGFGSMWIACEGAGKVFRLDPESARVTGSVQVASPTDVVAAAGSLWAPSRGDHVARIDPDAMKVTDEIKVPAAHAIASAFGSIWVSSGGEGGTVTRIDPETNDVIATIKTHPTGFPDRMTTADGLLWVGQFELDSLVGIDPATDEVAAELPAGNGAAVIAAGFGDLWVANFNDYDVWRIDPSAR